MKIKNLVLSGGGLRGYCYLSLLKVMEEMPDMFELKKIAGTSVGAIFATFISMGVTYKELQQQLLKKDTNDFKHIKLENIIKFLERFGVDDGHFFIDFVAHFVSQKFNNTEITLGEAYQKTGIELHLTGTCLNTRQPVYFSHNNYPNMPLLLAVRISISIPFYFIPIYFENRLYVDGGVVDNFPVQLFENELEQTLAIYLLDDREISENVDNFEDYAYAIFFASNNKRELTKLQKYEPYCLDIPLKDVGVYTNSLNQKTRDEWENIGYNLLRIYIKKRKLYPPPTYKEYLKLQENDICNLDTEVHTKELFKLKENICSEINQNMEVIINNVFNKKINEIKQLTNKNE
jgi:predicted acylesterase/phospholipase RssA